MLNFEDKQVFLFPAELTKLHTENESFALWSQSDEKRKAKGIKDMIIECRKLLIVGFHLHTIYPIRHFLLFRT